MIQFQNGSFELKNKILNVINRYATYLKLGSFVKTTNSPSPLKKRGLYQENQYRPRMILRLHVPQTNEHHKPAISS